jgi:hypothetical protein
MSRKKKETPQETRFAVCVISVPGNQTVYKVRESNYPFDVYSTWVCKSDAEEECRRLNAGIPL